MRALQARTQAAKATRARDSLAALRARPQDPDRRAGSRLRANGMATARIWRIPRRCSTGARSLPPLRGERDSATRRERGVAKAAKACCLRGRPSCPAGEPRSRASAASMRTHARLRGHPVRASEPPGRARRAVGHWPRMGERRTSPDFLGACALSSFGADSVRSRGSFLRDERPRRTDQAGWRASIGAKGSRLKPLLQRRSRESRRANARSPGRSANSRRRRDVRGSRRVRVRGPVPSNPASGGRTSRR